MYNRIVPISVLAAAVTLLCAQSTASFADVVVNNVFSPFTSIEVGPGYGYVGPRYYRSEFDYGPRYYERHYFYERPQRRGRPPRGAMCWRSTDKDRGYGYWDWCR